MGIELGRIKGTDLSPNLLRQGVDLAFDTDLLYLDVNTQKIGINTDSPTHDLTINDTYKTDRINSVNRINVGNIIIDKTGYFTSTVGPIEVRPTGPDGATYTGQVVVSNDIKIDDNVISSLNTNTNIEFRTSGTGEHELLANTNITGNLNIFGNVQVDGNLRSFSTITIGDTAFDNVTISTDFNQNIRPGDDALYDFGKTDKRWALAYPETISGVDKFNPQTAYLSTQMLIDGINNEITALQSNEDIIINPDTGIIYIERTKWQDSEITNLNSTPIILSGTGRGYVVIPGTSGFVMPAGSRAERPLPPQRVTGMTRYNTEDGFVECWSEVEGRWIILTGPGATVTEEIVEDLSYTYNLIFGV
jgi:hypothetical protein